MLVMNSVYLILGTFLFLIFVLPFNTNTIIAQTDYSDCKITQISIQYPPECKKVCDLCDNDDRNACKTCDQCLTPGLPHD